MFYPGGGYAGFYFWPAVSDDTDAALQEVHDFEVSLLLSYGLVTYVDRQLDGAVTLVAMESFNVEAER